MLGYMFTPYRNNFYSVTPSASYVDMQTEELSQQFNRRIESLELACAGLWELLKSKHGYTDEELVAAVTKIDESDGTLDGRLRPTDETCPRCGQKLLSRKSPNCNWCGAD
jgi:hypothetical protein